MLSYTKLRKAVRDSTPTASHTQVPTWGFRASALPLLSFCLLSRLRQIFLSIALSSPEACVAAILIDSDSPSREDLRVFVEEINKHMPSCMRGWINKNLQTTLLQTVCPHSQSLFCLLFSIFIGISALLVGFNLLLLLFLQDELKTVFCLLPDEVPRWAVCTNAPRLCLMTGMHRQDPSETTLRLSLCSCFSDA